MEKNNKLTAVELLRMKKQQNDIINAKTSESKSSSFDLSTTNNESETVKSLDFTVSATDETVTLSEVSQKITSNIDEQVKKAIGEVLDVKEVIGEDDRKSTFEETNDNAQADEDKILESSSTEITTDENSVKETVIQEIVTDEMNVSETEDLEKSTSDTLDAIIEIEKFAGKNKTEIDIEDVIESFESENLDEFISFDDTATIDVSEDINQEEKVEFVENKNSSSLFEWAEALAVAILCVSFIFIFIIRIVSVSGESMMPTLEHGDRLVITNLFYEPEYKDIVVLTKASYMDEPMVKRVIATEGQTVDIDFSTGDVFVDDVLLDEKYINETTYTQYDVSFPQVVPEGHVFVMGDNRNHSSDSRVSGIGMIDRELILGKVILRLYPFQGLGAVE